MKKLSNLIKFSSNRKLGFRVQLFGRDFFPWIKNQGLGQMTRFLYFSLDFCHFFIKIMCFSSNFCPCSSFAGVQGLAFLSSSFRGLAFRSSISTSINVLKKMSKKLKKSSKNGGTALILVFGTVLFLVFLRCMQDKLKFIILIVVEGLALHQLHAHRLQPRLPPCAGARWPPDYPNAGILNAGISRKNYFWMIFSLFFIFFQ